MHRFGLISILMIGGTAACQTVPNSPGISLVEATLADVRDVTGQPGSPSLCTLGGDVCLDGAYRMTFRIDRTLSGPTVTGSLSVTETRAKPVAGVKYFVAVEHAKNGPEIVHENPASQGLCMDELAKTYGLEAQAAQFPCRG